MAAKPKSSKSAKTAAAKPSVAKTRPAKSAVAKAAPAKAAPAKAAKAPKAAAKPKTAAKAVKPPAKSKVQPEPAPAPAEFQPPMADESPTLIEACYVTFDSLPVQFQRAAAPSGSAAIAFETFAEAKARAIDHLIELIEEAEYRLHLLRQANSREEYPY